MSYHIFLFELKFMNFILFIMNIFEIIISGFALASDAFAVSISKGLSLKSIRLKDCFVVAIWFSIFQVLMPCIGYLFGIHFERIIVSVDHFVAFFLLSYIGGKMIYESFCNNEIDSSLSFKDMFMFAVATSIDALSFGIAYSLAYKENNVLLCFSLIFIITFIMCFLGVKLGSKLGSRFEKVSKVVGGVTLILLGINVLIDHLF